MESLCFVESFQQLLIVWSLTTNLKKEFTGRTPTDMMEYHTTITTMSYRRTRHILSEKCLFSAKKAPLIKIRRINSTHIQV
eukprot:scaffold3126_cov46-Attheya_sp.AAC.2